MASIARVLGKALTGASAVAVPAAFETMRNRATEKRDKMLQSFQMETLGAQQAFQAEESALQRGHQSAENLLDRKHRSGENALQREDAIKSLIINLASDQRPSESDLNSLTQILMEEQENAGIFPGTEGYVSAGEMRSMAQQNLTRSGYDFSGMDIENASMNDILRVVLGGGTNAPREPSPEELQFAKENWGDPEIRAFFMQDYPDFDTSVFEQQAPPAQSVAGSMAPPPAAPARYVGPREDAYSPIWEVIANDVRRARAFPGNMNSFRDSMKDPLGRLFDQGKLLGQ